MLRASFMFKSKTFDDNKAVEETIASTDSSICEVTSRKLLDIQGGRAVLSAAASIDLLYIDAKFATPLALPFKVPVKGAEIIFDEIEPSPVAEDIDNDYGENGKCEEVVESFPQIDIADSVKIWIEASATKSFVVKLTPEECTNFVAACQNCFGYCTARQIDAKTKEDHCKERRFGVIITKLKSLSIEDLRHTEIVQIFAVGGSQIFENRRDVTMPCVL